MRTARQLLALAVFCLHASQLGACGKAVTTIGETSELRSVTASGAGETSGPGGSAGTGNTAQDSGVPPEATDSSLPPIVASDDGKCVFSSLAAKRRELEMHILLDSNITLYGGVWQQTVEGLRKFTRAPASAGMYLGLRSFGSECVAEAYKQPHVNPDKLPNHINLIDKATMSQGLQGSPMRPALEGGIAFEQGRTVSRPEMKHIVVVLSDGFSGDIGLCLPPYAADDVAAVAAAGMALKVPIQTYLLPINTGFGNLVSGFQGLDAIAAAGGTDKPIEIAPGNIEASTEAALHTVRRRAQPCEYLLPGGVDPELVSLAMLPSEPGKTGEVARVADAAACGTLPGWYFVDPALPEVMRLCPNTCSTLQASDAYRIAPLQGCKPITRD